MVGNIKKDIHLALVLGLIFTVLLSMVSFEARCSEIRENVLRLHILANSDSAEDQQLKLKVRDRLLSEGAEIFGCIQTEQQALECARNNIAKLQLAAEDEVKKNGYNYPVKVEIGEVDFSTREYENFTLPAGRYEAVRVLIGNAQGQNWWCVMFPPVCLPAAEDQRELSDVLTKDSVEIIENPQNYKIRFKTVEIYESIKNKLGEWFADSDKRLKSPKAK
ncbi:MAG TPA: stage II sporulation protein R [Clostridiales bacterium]|nr:stage II sporulation protein R [Clostridiales bacterium]